MDDREPDYTKYSLYDLEDAAQHVDRETYADRAAHIDAELERRRGEGATRHPQPETLRLSPNAWPHRSDPPTWVFVLVTMFFLLCLVPFGICFGVLVFK